MISKDYIDELLLRIKSIIGENLIGLYLIGSVSMEDYVDDKSDLDVIGIIKSPLSPADKNLLEKILDNKNFPCPAKGLDFVLMTKNSVIDPKPESDYDFGYATGAGWPTESWSKGQSSEMIIFLELCRQTGLKIYGIDASKLI
jgi:hypothetical protein